MYYISLNLDGINLTTYNGLLLTRVWKFKFRYYGIPPGLRLTQGPVQAQTLMCTRVNFRTGIYTAIMDFELLSEFISGR